MNDNKFRERFEDMLRVRDVRQIDVCERTGISKSIISSYLKGTRFPKQDKIYAIAMAYNINPVWLMGYDVDMELKQKYSIVADAENIEKSQELQEIIDMFGELEKSDQIMILNMVKSLYEKTNAKKEVEF